MEVVIKWGKGGSFNHGRIDGTDIRIERYNTGTKKNPQWYFLIADSTETYLHSDNRAFRTKEDLEDAVMQWLVDAGHFVWLH